MLASFVNVLTM